MSALRLARSSIFSAVSFAAFLLLLVSFNSIVCYLSIHFIRSPELLLRTPPPPPPPTRASLLSITRNVLIRPRGTDEKKMEMSLIPPANVRQEERISWFKKNLNTLEILKSSKHSKKFDKRVKDFLHQGKCKVQFFMTWISSIRSFGSREFLVVESLFKVHPDGCLVIVSQSMDSHQGYRVFKPLLDRGFRVLSASPDLNFLLKNTPAQSWFQEMKTGKKDPGKIPLAQNLSNLIRLAVLYKYGGVYLDTDFVVLKDFSGLRNSIGAQSMNGNGNWSRLNNAALIFDKNHPLVYNFIKEYALNFDGNRWGHNGPYLVSRVVERLARKPGFNVTLLRPMAFYPVSWTRIDGLFKPPQNDFESRWMEAKVLQFSAETYGLHLWNRKSSSLTIEERSILSRLFLKTCITCEHIHTSKVSKS